jgi:uncharacterized protein YkwD
VIGGLLVDAIVVAAIFAFEWAGPQLGAEAAVRRAIGCIVGFIAAVLMRDPIGDLIEAIFHFSTDFSRLFAMLAVGFGVYMAAANILAWRDAQRVERIGMGYDAEEHGSPLLAALDGAFLGFAWAVLFIGLLVLMPADNFVSRAAVNSNVGNILIKQESALKWLSDGFPHYTQTLPKGEDGAVVGEHDSLPMHGDDAPRSAPGEADLVFRIINKERRARQVQALVFNPDISAVARRHAAALVEDRSMSYTSPGGGALDDRVASALGAAAADFEPKIGIEIAWSGRAANATHAMLDDDRAGAMLRDDKWSEIGIGVADAGWFNGKIYVLLLVAPLEDVAAGEEGDAGDDGEATDPFTGSADACPQPFDTDGDGTPDPESVDPSCAGADAGTDRATLQ